MEDSMDIAITGKKPMVTKRAKHSKKPREEKRASHAKKPTNTKRVNIMKKPIIHKRTIILDSQYFLTKGGCNGKVTDGLCLFS